MRELISCIVKIFLLIHFFTEVIVVEVAIVEVGFVLVVVVVVVAETVALLLSLIVEVVFVLLI